MCLEVLWNWRNQFAGVLTEVTVFRKEFQAIAKHSGEEVPKEKLEKVDRYLKEIQERCILIDNIISNMYRRDRPSTATPLKRAACR